LSNGHQFNYNTMDIVDQSLSKLVGLPCWGVRCDPWTGLELHFGTPTLQVREPHISTSKQPNVRRIASYRSISVRGTWWLWAWTGLWHLRLADDTTTFSKFTPSAHKRSRALNLLNGQKLLAFGVDPNDGRTEMLFDCGAALRLWENRSADGEIWSLYQPQERVLSVRADGRFSNQLSTQDNRWRPR
jgi:hypothetical protein